MSGLLNSSVRVVLWVRWSIVISLWSLLISMAAGQTGISNFRQLLQNKEALEAVNNQLSYENAKLTKHLANLRTSTYHQKRYLKEEFGVVEQDEIVVRFSSDNLPAIRTKYADKN